MNQHVTNLAGSYISHSPSDRLQYLNTQHGYSFPQHPSLSVQTRNLPSGGYYPGDGQFETESHGENYMISSPATPIAPHDPYGTCSLHDGARSWSVANGRFMPPYYPRYGAHENNSYSHEPIAGSRRPSAAEGPGPFSTAALVMSLPSPNSVVGDRELPLPHGGSRVQLQTPTYDGVQNRGGILAENFAQAGYNKTAQRWKAGQTTPAVRDGSLTSSRCGNVAASAPQKSSTTPSTASDGSSATLLASASPGSCVSPTTGTTAEHATAGSALVRQSPMGIDHPFFSIPTASTSEPRLSGPGSNFSSFSIAKRQPSGSEIPSSTDERQMDIQQYVPLSYPSDTDSRGGPLSSFRHDSVDGRAHELPHRSSMPIVSPDS
ncbi:uncharacterized protein PV09_06353 [Verruconis gallopava]|uniref:Uncharacterized protein n=1 Tax=Verruconis gallopava TaxID=253628 RepID=A0A0D1YN69_9PEZI|nr:uncharacterized protein PV09_06353 [Verruconis gallopava]KIW02197.1 hypothetical protein PV09_06353 [Verruconis gallopava]